MNGLWRVGKLGQSCSYISSEDSNVACQGLWRAIIPLRASFLVFIFGIKLYKGGERCSILHHFLSLPFISNVSAIICSSTCLRIRERKGKHISYMTFKTKNIQAEEIAQSVKSLREFNPQYPQNLTYVRHSGGVPEIPVLERQRQDDPWVLMVSKSSLIGELQTRDPISKRVGWHS